MKMAEIMLSIEADIIESGSKEFEIVLPAIDPAEIAKLPVPRPRQTQEAMEKMMSCLANADELC